jgi:hypothetical protein
MSRESISRKSRRRQVALKDHRREKKALVPHLAPSHGWVIERDGILPTAELLDEFLPEHLWLANLSLTGSINDVSRRFNWACDIIDEFLAPDADVFLGYMSDFSFVPEANWNAARLALEKDLIYAGFDHRFRAVLALYPACPAKWLAVPEPTDAYLKLAELITALRSFESSRMLRCRVVGLNRLLKHRKVVLRRGPDSTGTS